VECQSYLREIQQYPPKYRVFLDEMCTADGKFRRRRGYFRRGEPPIMAQFLGFQDQTGTSLIAACNIREVILTGCELTFETNTRETFENYITNVLGPHICAYPGPNSVVVMDNCTLHHSDTITAFIKSKDAILIYLPPYSPQYNPSN
jgi:hypothetical protein